MNAVSGTAHDHDSLSYPSSIESPVDDAPDRVISLVPSMTESLFDLDLGDRLIATTDDCIHPADKVQLVTSVGGSRSPDLEQIINLQPDLVLLNVDENRHGDIETLQAENVPVWITGPRTVLEALNVLWAMMDIFDHAVMVPRVREIERAYDYTDGAARAQTPIRVFAPLSVAPWTTFNADSFANDVLRVCGGENVFAGHCDPFPEITLDDIEAAQPDVVFLPVAMDVDLDLLRGLAIPAAQNERIHLIDETLLTWHGTRIAFALRDLPALIMEEQ